MGSENEAWACGRWIGLGAENTLCGAGAGAENILCWMGAGADFGGSGKSISIYSGSGVAISCGFGPCVAESGRAAAAMPIKAKVINKNFWKYKEKCVF